MTIKGIPLASYKLELIPVSSRHNEEPIRSIDHKAIIGEKNIAKMREHWSGETFTDLSRNLPLRVLQRFFTLDQIAKIKFSNIIMMDDSVEKFFETDPDAHLLYKIRSSMWRWGYGGKLWNDIIRAQRGVRSFDLGLSEDFTVTLDYTNSVNPRGPAKYSNTFLDGVFAYLVHYRGEHVMTLGFSIMAGRRVLIQQVQLVKPKGNRFLFKFPTKRMEFVIDRFRAAFPDHKIFVVDGGGVLRVSLDSYKRGLKRAQEGLEKGLGDIVKGIDSFEARLIDDYRDDMDKYREKISHLSADLPRLRSFYRDIGRYRARDELVVNELKHYRVMTR